MRVDVIFDEREAYEISYQGRTIAPGPGPLPSPPVFFLGSVAACAGVYAVKYLKSRSLPFAGIRVIGEANHVEDPRRLADLRLRVILPVPIEERHMGLLHRSVDLCLLKNSLTHPPSVIAEVCGSEDVPAPPALTSAS